MNIKEVLMDRIVDSVIQAICRAGLVQVEVSARHVHLTQEDFERLFGYGKQMTPKRDLSQPGQYLAEERVTLIGPKGRKVKVAVLGPVRKDTQVELSSSDCRDLGISAPIRESGDVKGSAGIIIEGPCGKLEIQQGVIVALKHVHLPTKVANDLGLVDKQLVNVQIYSDRPLIFQDVLIRVSDQFCTRMHIDFDEANAAGVTGFVLGKIIK